MDENTATAPLDLEEIYANLPWTYPVNRDEEEIDGSQMWPSE